MKTLFIKSVQTFLKFDIEWVVYVSDLSKNS